MCCLDDGIDNIAHKSNKTPTDQITACVESIVSRELLIIVLLLLRFILMIIILFLWFVKITRVRRAYVFVCLVAAGNIHE